VSGPYCGEVTTVKGGDLGFPEALASRNHSRVYQAKAERFVCSFKLGGPSNFVFIGVVDQVRARRDVVGECSPRTRARKFAQPIVNLYQDEVGHYECLTESLNKRLASLLVGVVGGDIAAAPGPRER
jgi:hypothetical protein